MPQLIGIKQEALPTLFTVQKPVPTLTSRFCTSLLWGACKLTKSNEPTVPARGEEGMPAVFLCATTPFLSENQATTARCTYQSTSQRLTVRGAAGGQIE